MADAQTMKDAYGAMMTAVSSGDLESVAAGLTDDYQWHGNGGETKDKAGLLEMIQGYVTAFPGMQFHVHAMANDGDKLLIHWSVTGTNSGPLGEMPATGRALDMPGHVVLRFEGNLVAEEWELFDEALMMQQLGVA